MKKLDLTKKYKAYYTSKTRPEVVNIEKAQYLTICGKGDPDGPEFAQRVGALYPIAYTLKFTCKERGEDFIVPKLEGLWSFNEKKYPHQSMTNASVEVPRNEWEYRLLIRLPDFVTKHDFKNAVQTVLTKKDLHLAKEVEFFEMNEGKSVQMLHIGPFSAEPDTLKKIGKFITDNKLKRNGPHHEIYLSDFRKTKPEKLRTILREPVR